MARLIIIHFILLQLNFLFGWSLLCNQVGGNMWCARQQPMANFVNTSIEADSCYCLIIKNMTQQQAFNNCTAFGGFLTDIQNIDENKLISVFLETAKSSSEISSVICGQQGVYFNGRCYNYTSKLQKNWLDAEKYCQNTFPGGHLASIHNLAEQRYLYNLTKNCSDCSVYGFWVGANNYGDPNKWLWSDGTAMDYSLEVTKNKNWEPQPEDPKHQNCITICKLDGGWGDWFCTDSSNFVCSFPPVIFPAWIGLQKTLSGHAWNLGNNCHMTSPTFEAWDELAEVPIKIAYLYQANMTWSAALPNSTAMAAVCRLDQDICGRNPCPSSVNTCIPNKGGVACYTCV